MIGFLFGTACLVGFLATRARRRRGWAAYGSGWAGPGGCGAAHAGPEYGYGPPGWTSSEPCGPWARPDLGGGFPGGGGRWGGRRYFLRAVLARLDATPAQEKVVVEAVDELVSRGREARRAAAGARGEIARAMREASVDETALGAAQAKLDEATDIVKRAGAGAFVKIHGALDEHQRRVVAEHLERGPGAFRGFAFGGPYRRHGEV